MYPDLVCPTGPRSDFQQTESIHALHDMETGLAWFPFTVVHHRAMAVTHIHTQRVTGRVLFPFRLASNDRVVHLLHFMLFELHTQCAVGFRGTGKDHHPAGDFVQPMDDPDLPNLLLNQPDQIGAILGPTIRQHRDPGGFVYDEKFCIFVQDQQAT
jgi:hypothetical protein